MSTERWLTGELNLERIWKERACFYGPVILIKVKSVKCTLVQALRLCTGRTAHTGVRGVALLFLDHGTGRDVGSASHPGRSLLPGKTRYTLYRRLGGPQARSEQVRKISPPTGIRSLDRPARNQSLYRLRYPAHCYPGICKKWGKQTRNVGIGSVPVKIRTMHLRNSSSTTAAPACSVVVCLNEMTLFVQ